MSEWLLFNGKVAILSATGKLVHKGHSRDRKMCLLWTVAVYIQVKIIYTIHNWGQWDSDLLYRDALYHLWQVWLYIMASTGYISLRWWLCTLCTRPTRLVRWITTKHGYQSKRTYGKVVRKQKMDSYIVG